MTQPDEILKLLAARGRGATYDQLARELYGVDRMADPQPGQLGAVRSSVSLLRAQGLVRTSRPPGTFRRADASSRDHVRAGRRWRNPAAVVVELDDAS
jgi:hypothetical protein